MKSSSSRRKMLFIVGVAFLGAFLIIYVTFRHDLAAARDRVSTGSQIVDTPCGLIEYAVAGTGPPLLMVHGAGGGFDQGMETGQPLVGSNFQTIAMSRFGYLRTPLPADASPTAQADAHACLLDALDARKAFVVGASIGAPSAIQFCLRHARRCTALVLAVPILFVPTEEAEMPKPPSAFSQWLVELALSSDFVFWLGTKIARQAVVESVLATPYAELTNASPAEQARVLQTMRHILPISLRAEGLKNDMKTELPRYALEQINVPTLVISTETDLFGTYQIARYTAEQIPGARFLGYTTGGHVWVGRNLEMRSEIATFLHETKL